LRRLINPKKTKIFKAERSGNGRERIHGKFYQVTKGKSSDCEKEKDNPG
jgi:hypothetical protein